jgi:hypothetical protein
MFGDPVERLAALNHVALTIYILDSVRLCRAVNPPLCLLSRNSANLNLVVVT